MRAASVRSDSEDLTTLGPRAVLAALAARTVREVLGTAGGVGTRHQGRRDGLPLRATVARVATRHLPLRDSHCVLLGRFAQSSWSCRSGARLAHRGSIAASCVWSGSSARRAPH